MKTRHREDKSHKGSCRNFFAGRHHPVLRNLCNLTEKSSKSTEVFSKPMIFHEARIIECRWQLVELNKFLKKRIAEAAFKIARKEVLETVFQSI